MNDPSQSTFSYDEGWTDRCFVVKTVCPLLVAIAIAFALRRWKPPQIPTATALSRRSPMNRGCRFPLSLRGTMVVLPLLLTLAYMLGHVVVELSLRAVDFIIHAPMGLLLAVIVGLAAMRTILPLRQEEGD